MNLNMSPSELTTLLFRRIQNAGFPIRHQIDVPPLEMSEPLMALLGRGWHHLCHEEPAVFIPAAVIVPCDMSFLFEPGFNLFDEFQYLCSDTPIRERAYYLEDIRVFHSHMVEDLEISVQGGYSYLTLLESGQLLAQMSQISVNSTEERGIGSITTRNVGLPVISNSADDHVALRLHVYHNWHKLLVARKPSDGEANHHVAVCRRRIGVPRTQQILGTLKSLR